MILNPTAGMGRAGLRRAELEGLLASSGIRYELRTSDRAGHAAELAKGAAAEGFGAVAAAGGDGTVNEAINGLMAAKAAGAPACDFAVLPMGRGNDFAYGAGIPSDLAAAVALIAEGRRRPLDVGLVRGGDYPAGKHFGNGIGIGFDTIVGLTAARMKRVHGFMAYVLGALATFVRYPEAPLVRLISDSLAPIEQRSHQISLMNGKRMGGTFFMAPGANNGDGLLNLCMAGELGRAAMLGLMVRYIKGTQEGHPLIRTGLAARYRIESSAGPLICHADGETICVDGRLLEVECLAGALSIYCGDQDGAPAGK